MKALTADVLKAAMPGCPTEHLGEYSRLLSSLMEKFEINTLNRCSYFLGQIAWESNYLKLMREVWDTAKVPNQLRYERNFGHPWPHSVIDTTNKLAYRLGNSEKNDGYLFRGFGPLGVTGRGNTQAASLFLYGDSRLVDNPALLDTAEAGFGAAVWYWHDRKINAKADVQDYKGATVLINGDCTDGYPSYYLKRVSRLQGVLAAIA